MFSHVMQVDTTDLTGDTRLPILNNIMVLSAIGSKLGYGTPLPAEKIWK